MSDSVVGGLRYRIEPPTLRIALEAHRSEGSGGSGGSEGSGGSGGTEGTRGSADGVPASETVRGAAEPSRETLRSLPLVLCLHGWGMDGNWFARLTQGLFELPAVFVFPTAPKAVTKDDGSTGWSWYDYDGDSASFVEELKELELLLLGFLREFESEHGLEPPSRALLGFSQGGYGGSFVALRNPGVFGALAISGARVKDEALGDDLAAAAAGGIQVLACHGSRDPYVKKERSRASVDALTDAGIEARWEEFDAGHSLGRSQVRLMKDWLAQRFGAPERTESS